VRAAVLALIQSTQLSPQEAEAMTFAANEVTVNAIRHGRAPVSVQAWAGPRHVAVAVSDVGPGPADPLVGLATSGPGDSGRGLWLLHRMVDVQQALTGDGYTALVSTGDPHA